MKLEAGQLKRWLGSATVSFSDKVGRRIFSGYCGKRAMQLGRAERHILDNQQEAAELDFSLVCGHATAISQTWKSPRPGAVFLYAIADVSQMELFTIFEVGIPYAYNDATTILRAIQNNPDGVLAQAFRMGRITKASLMRDRPPVAVRTRNLRRAVKQVYQRFPFHIYFADRMGLKAKFLEPISRQDAPWIAQKVLRVNIEAVSAVEPLSLEEYIVKRQELRLWWD